MRLALIFALLGVCVASPARTQTPAQQAQIVMQQAVEAMGGAEAIANVTNLSVRAACKGVRGGEYTVEVQSILPDRTLFRETLPRQVTEMTAVGDVAWRRGPGKDELVLLDPQYAQALRQREIHLMLANLVKRYTNHKVLGTEIRDGAPCSLMEMQDEWGQMGSVCFDLKTHLPMEVQYRRPPDAGGGRVQINLDKWTKVGDVLFPVALSRTEGTDTFSVRYELIQLGLVKEELFEIPAEIQEQLERAGRE